MPGRGVTPHLLGHPGVGIRVLAQRRQTALAEEAGAARDRERDHHGRPASGSSAPARFDHLSHELVAQDVTLFHRRYKGVEEVEIDPQMAVDAMRTIARCGFRIFGSGTCSTLTFLFPSQQFALISFALLIQLWNLAALMTSESNGPRLPCLMRRDFFELLLLGRPRGMPQRV